jgi:hypothetical protein
MSQGTSSSAPAGWWRDTITGYLLRLATAAALVIDAVVHLQDAHFYDVAVGGVLTQGQLFRIQSVVAIVVALAVLVWPKWPSWLVAVLVAGSAVTAVATYTYVDIGPFAGLPGMYEPSWGPPGKLLSACAEGAGTLLALAGLARALVHRRQDRAGQRGHSGDHAMHQPAPGR